MTYIYVLFFSRLLSAFTFISLLSLRNFLKSFKQQMKISKISLFLYPNQIIIYLFAKPEQQVKKTLHKLIL